MKKTYLTFAFILFIAICNAQTDKGKFRIGGDIGLSFSSTTYKSGNAPVAQNLNLTGGVGYFVINNLSVDLSIGATTEWIGKDSIITSTYFAMPGLTYYIPTQSNIRPFLTGGYGFAGRGDNNQYWGTVYGGSIGVSIFVRKNISFDAGVQYLGLNLRQEANSNLKIKSQTLGGALSFSIFL